MKRKIEKAKFNLLDEYKIVGEYVRGSKKFIYFITGIFFVFLLIGFLVPAPEFLYDRILEYIRELLEKTEAMSPLELIWFILSNNVTSTFFIVILGIVLGIFPVLNAIANGYMLGFVSSISVQNGGFLTLWKILPHGIFELPAVFISLGLGAKLGTFIFQKNKWISFKSYLINSLRAFILVVIPLLIVAGIIEGVIMVLLS